jgi:hypothetical protein
LGDRRKTQKRFIYSGFTGAHLQRCGALHPIILQPPPCHEKETAPQSGFF